MKCARIMGLEIMRSHGGIVPLGKGKCMVWEEHEKMEEWRARPHLTIHEMAKYYKGE